MYPPSITGPRPGWQRGWPAWLAALALLLPACEGGGQFTLLGYTTRPQYDPNIHTVYVPIFKNKTLVPRLEDELTHAVIREIEAKTPFKVVSSAACADTILEGTIISLNKLVINRTAFNEIREANTTLGVEVVWKDLRTGEILSQPRPPGVNGPPVHAVPPPPEVLGGAPVLPPDAPPVGPLPPAPAPVPVLVQAQGDFIPEIGSSLTTAVQQMSDRLAVQIVSMMEKAW